jgi:hypothetical protein
MCDQTQQKFIEEGSTVTKETTAHTVPLDQFHTIFSSDACLLYSRLLEENGAFPPVFAESTTTVELSDP